MRLSTNVKVSRRGGRVTGFIPRGGPLYINGAIAKLGPQKSVLTWRDGDWLSSSIERREYEDKRELANYQLARGISSYTDPIVIMDGKRVWSCPGHIHASQILNGASDFSRQDKCGVEEKAEDMGNLRKVLRGKGGGKRWTSKSIH